ncbi:hypothetical protein [Micromonospora sp. WMMD980]|uniref:hypothetical protein n=1 Tax=Micromonospora sp. WMMD980 TaxID=3016088 RepID=UPI002415AD8E|nr:hypothetical protein [Micromonospora sp. WMMD980]MDG4800183.1 hypothetical protein [Micromonospora sp. WMMD980]
MHANSSLARDAPWRDSGGDAQTSNLVVATLYIPVSVYNADGESWAYASFYGLSIELELLILAVILRAAWTWPRTVPATAGGDLAHARV